MHSTVLCQIDIQMLRYWLLVVVELLVVYYYIGDIATKPSFSDCPTKRGKELTASESRAHCSDLANSSRQ